MDLAETVEEDGLSTSTNPLPGEEKVGVADWGVEKLHNPTGEFDPVQRMSRPSLQSTDVIEQVESLSVGSKSWSYKATFEQPPDEIGSSLRETEKAWIDSHIEELSTFAGEWLVVEGDQLVAHNADLVDAIKQARARGVQVPYVTRLPLEKEKPFIGCNG